MAVPLIAAREYYLKRRLMHVVGVQTRLIHEAAMAARLASLKNP
jgi:hypothetical protein